MDLCAYCGRRLPLLHRIVGSGRFCSKRHAELYQKELDELSLEALSRLRPAAKACAPVAGEPGSAGPPERGVASRTAEEAVPDPALESLPVEIRCVNNELAVRPAPADYLNSAPAFQLAARPCLQAGAPPRLTSLLELPLEASRPRAASTVPVWPLPARRRLFAPAMRPGAVGRGFGGPGPALDAQRLALPSAIGGSGERRPARRLEFLPACGPEMPRLRRWGAAPLSAPCAQDCAGLSCPALPAPARAGAVAERIATLAEPVLPARRFRVRFATPIPPLSTYEGSTAASAPPSPVRRWSPPLFLDGLTRRAARVSPAAVETRAPAVAIGPVQPEARRAPLPAPPRRAAGRGPLFIPKGLVYPVRPACRFGPLPSSRPLPPSRPAGAVVPIRSAAKGVQGVGSAARRASMVLP